MLVKNNLKYNHLKKLQYNFVIKRSLFKTVAGKFLSIGASVNKGIHLNRPYVPNSPYATGDRSFGRVTLGNQTASKLTIEGKDTHAMQKHSGIFLENANGNKVLDCIATHSKSYTDKTTGAVTQHTKVGDGISDYAGKKRPQYLSADSSIQGEIDMSAPDNKFTPDPVFEKFCILYKVREVELEQKKQDFLKKELLKNKDKEDV